ncbi:MULTISPECIES: antibiotic biosynthesis monooxygenase family protein [Pseudomonas aeruginosa group]|uniref:antibiotic biosynthesis monooxygenase family protein n=1 Tax=Pseudomonas aeruginosa group TaxID=136841 RepID=UPI00086DD464|nr:MULTISPECIES: antibiotic biosynthesis monooxygenase family protein [Pseudomonas aeruginosa group]AVR65694.1 antibiotic biosynthesis monooxygenase [Pseudomonas paraeruginosa]MBG3905360.1 antibiotic biosynthesis monooxygenase [Pseudomonas aeruginosa]MBG4200423.1 antibiotic biosynthesis monooxygenase [Pseudomonas aeruginosa]MBG4278019.1 antibiotic biosynthesis monooxygenase [Pseudomonas aeruginosa]MBG6891752.1 antibiotic biosynthesis monooxygenase [Pseudomonas aeruginosa]
MSASQVFRIRARKGQSDRLGLRLRQLSGPGREAPGCLDFQVRRDALEADVWLIRSQWREPQQMLDYLCGEIQQVFAEVLWRSLAASLEVRDEEG